ncbi:kelch-like protein 9 isoform X1 [Argonauta hians]
METKRVLSKKMSEGEDFKSEGYGDRVIEKLNVLRNNSELCDFKVSAEGKVFEVHKALLAAASDYFRVMFRGMMAESKQDTVDLKGVTADGLQQVIDFIYTGKMSLYYDNLTEIINTASHLQVSYALDLCSNYIKSLMTFDNADDFLSIADTYSLEKVLNHWDDMILSNFHEFSNSQAFLKLSAQKLVKYLSSNLLCTVSEYRLYQCLEKWLSVSPSRVTNDSSILMPHLRFPLMSLIELTSIKDSELFQKVPNGAHYIAKGFQYHIDCKQGHPVIDESSTIRTNTPSLVLVHHGTAYMPFQVTSYYLQGNKFFRLFSDVNGSRDCRIAVIDNFAYICRVVDFGGGTLMSSLFRFDPRHLVGQELHPMKQLRLDFALTAHDHRLYVFGGSTEQFAILDSVECYNVKTNMWEELLYLPNPVHSLATVVHEMRIYLSGGVTGQERQATNSFMCFNILSHRYEVKPGMFYARRLHDMVAFQQKIYVHGGIPRQGIPLHGQIPIEYFDLTSEQWTILTSSTLSGRSIGHYIVFQNQVLCLGHEHHRATEDEIWIYDTVLDDWSKYTKAPQRMSLTTAVCVQMYINFNEEKVAKMVLKEK